MLNLASEVSVASFQDSGQKQEERQDLLSTAGRTGSARVLSLCQRCQETSAQRQHCTHLLLLLVFLLSPLFLRAPTAPYQQRELCGQLWGGRLYSLNPAGLIINECVYPNERKSNPLLEKPNLYFNYYWCYYYYYCCCSCHNWILSSPLQLLLLPPSPKVWLVCEDSTNNKTIVQSVFGAIEMFTGKRKRERLACRREGLQFSCSPTKDESWNLPAPFIDSSLLKLSCFFSSLH